MKTARKASKHTPIVIGNWKMNPQSLQKATELAQEIKKMLPKSGAAQVCVAAPSLFITEVGKKLQTSRATLCAQDVSSEEMGAHTGEVSTAMLKSLSVTHVIVGHSERRAMGEGDAVIAQKVERIHKSGLIAVACIGERNRDIEGNYFNEVESQLHAILRTLAPRFASKLIIAYEPIWAIGTGKNATAEDVQEMKLFIQKVIADSMGRSVVAKIRIIYGGSVTSDNAENLLEVGGADGFLVGGASLKALDFAAIVKTADNYAA